MTKPENRTEEEWQAEFEKTTGKNAIYRGRITKGYLTWVAKQRKDLGIGSDIQKESENKTIPKKTKKSEDIIEKKSSEMNETQKLEYEDSKEEKIPVEEKPIEEKLVEEEISTDEEKPSQETKPDVSETQNKKEKILETSTLEDQTQNSKEIKEETEEQTNEEPIINNGKSNELLVEQESQNTESDNNEQEQEDSPIFLKEISSEHASNVESNKIESGQCPKCGTKFNYYANEKRKRFCSQCGEIVRDSTGKSKKLGKNKDKKPKPPKEKKVKKEKVKKEKMKKDKAEKKPVPQKEFITDICDKCGTPYKYYTGGFKQNFCNECGNQLIADEEKRVFTKEEIETAKKSNNKKKSDFKKKLKEAQNFGRMESSLQWLGEWGPFLAIILQLIVSVSFFSSRELWAALQGTLAGVSINDAKLAIWWNIVRLVIGAVIITYMFIKLKLHIINRQYEKIMEDDLFFGKIPIKIPFIIVFTVLFFISAEWGGLILLVDLVIMLLSPYRLKNWKNSNTKTNETPKEQGGIA